MARTKAGTDTNRRERMKKKVHPLSAPSLGAC
jgi:hypothetical protein